jgi:hypothetical protein
MTLKLLEMLGLTKRKRDICATCIKNKYIFMNMIY